MTLMRTTTFVVNAPIDPQPLDAHFTLIRYDLPARLKFLMERKAAKAFEQIHIEIRSQLRQPYYFYMHDRLGSSDYAVYVLYKGTDSVCQLELRLLDSAQLPQRTVSFRDIPHHLTLKLLQAQYFGEEESTRFTSQGKHFLLARSGTNRFIGLEIEIKGAKENNKHEGSQVYRLLGRATRFIRVDDPSVLNNHQITTWEYVQRLSPKDGLNLLSVIPPNQVRNCPHPIFRIYREQSSRPTLDYHAQRNYKQTRGYLLSSFITAFINYLARFGIDATQEYREFTQHRTDKKQMSLHIPAGTVICLLDQRLNQHDVPYAAYLACLTEMFPRFVFAPIADMLQANQRPTLIIQDVTANAFDAGGILAGERDPYQDLYRTSETADWPKQSICVNPNDAETMPSREAYLSYPLCDFGKPNGFPLRFQVCLNQLVIKDLILNDTPVAERLPFMTPTRADTASLQSYFFARRQTYKGVSYPVLLFFQEGYATFLDLRSPGDKERRDTLLADLGLDWTRDVLDPWRAKNRIDKAEDEVKTPYHFILGQGQVIEIEDCQEHVLYEYDRIGVRQAAVEEPLLITALKLAPHYDVLRTQHMVPLAQLVGTTPSGPSKVESPDRLHASAAFYDQLIQIDAFLDELGAHHRRISFNALTSGENGIRLDAILFPEGKGTLGPEETDESSRVRPRLKRLYQRHGMFLSDKAIDVQYYHGIWVNPDGRFMVGSPNQIKFDQPRAHIIRRFHTYTGHDRFPIELFLNTLGVLFVRPEQYTVYPYPFHLIDQYVKIKLHWNQ